MSPGMQWLDPLVTLALCAAVTDRVRLGTSVLVLPYRNPLNLAAEAAALDVLTEGRFVLGVGCGWMQEEFTALGIDPAERGPRTDEHIEVLRTLWTQDPASFQGRFNNFDGIVLATTTRTEGGPPIWVGGNTDPGLRRALRLGDGWHGFEVYPEDMPDVNERLARIGGEVGRDPARAGAERRARADSAGTRGGVLRPRPADAGRVGPGGGGRARRRTRSTASMTS